MKWTNRNNRPQPLVDIITNDKYSKGASDISITGLAKPPRVRVLEKIHADDIVIDIDDRISSLLGKLMHSLLEQASKSFYAEKRFYLEIEGITISGQLDAYYENGVLDDYKLLPVRKMQNGVPEEFVAQMNSYALLLKEGYYLDDKNEKIFLDCDVKTLQIQACFRDWFQAAVGRGEYGYPQTQWGEFPVELWDIEKTRAHIIERIRLHKAANKTLPLCTPEERWAEPEKYAVMKKGAKKSLKNHLSREMADQHAFSTPGAFVEVRPGSSKRCERWCDVRDFCTQYKEEVETRNNPIETISDRLKEKP